MTHRRRSSRAPRGQHGLDDQAAVLFVDDDRALRRAFARCIERHGFEVEVAATATEALRRVQAGDFAALVTDLLLPGVSGESLVHELSQLAPNLPIVVVTGQPSLAAAQRLAELDAVVRVMEKPWHELDLVRAIGMAVERHDRAWLSSLPPPARASDDGVLVVVEDPYDAELVEAYLTPGFAVRKVSTAEEAQHQLRGSTVGAIVADVDLPDAGGMELVMRLHAAAPDTAIITIGASQSETMALTALRAGAQDHFAKLELGPRLLQRAVRRARERIRVQRGLGRLGQHDELTGLARDGLLQDRLHHAVARAQRRTEVVGLMTVELDGLQDIELRFGPEVADAVLCEVATRVQGLVREYDLVARPREDVLAVLVDAGPDTVVPGRVAERVRAAMSKPVQVDALSLDPRARIGLSQYPGTAADPVELMQEAKAATRVAGQEAPRPALARYVG